MSDTNADRRIQAELKLLWKEAAEEHWEWAEAYAVHSLVVVDQVVAEIQVLQDPWEESHHGRVVQDVEVQVDHFQGH